MQTRSASSAKKIRREETAAQVMELRRARLTFCEIASRLKISKSEAQRIATREMAIFREQNQMLTADMITIELATLDRLQRKYQAIALDAKGSVGAARVVIKVMERRAKMMGLDGPTKIDITDKTQPAITSDDPIEAAQQYEQLVSATAQRGTE